MEAAAQVSSVVPLTRPVKDQAGALAYQNDQLVVMYAERYEVPIERAQALFQAVKQFLVLCATMAEPCSPTPEIDEMWHWFILNTRAYREYCQRYFGYFIDHLPTGGQEHVRDRSGRMMRHLAVKLFGPLDATIWGRGGEFSCGVFCGDTCDACAGVKAADCGCHPGCPRSVL